MGNLFIKHSKFTTSSDEKFSHKFVFFLVSLTGIFNLLFIYVTRVKRGAILDSKTQIREIIQFLQNNTDAKQLKIGKSWVSVRATTVNLWGAKASIEKKDFHLHHPEHRLNRRSVISKERHTSISVRNRQNAVPSSDHLTPVIRD